LAGVFNDVEYARVGDISLRMDGSVPASSRPVPAVVLVHGGGWVRGDRTIGNIQALTAPLQEAGFAWFSISYRLAKDLLDFGAAVDDVQQAVQHLRRNAATYGIDPSRIVLAGESAGAHLVSMAALRDPSSVSGVVSLYGPLDLVDLVRKSEHVPQQLRDAVTGSIFGDLAAAFLRNWSPIAHVRPDAPPFLLVHGTADRVVPYEQSVLMHQRLKSVGARSDLVTVEGGGHGVRGWLSSKAWIVQMTDWLRKHLIGPVQAASTAMDRAY
jgi:alpha-L-fucosidase 2